ncbi:hypothetical protein ACFRK5_14675 [Streptomyces niveus]|uniref:hypothetical protein n=1 Tax=Streptomyces niveus TaxID=193462 RepID=UPI0036C10511
MGDANGAARRVRRTARTETVAACGNSRRVPGTTTISARRATHHGAGGRVRAPTHRPRGAVRRAADAAQRERAHSPRTAAGRAHTRRTPRTETVAACGNRCVPGTTTISARRARGQLTTARAVVTQPGRDGVAGGGGAGRRRAGGAPRR